MLVFYTFIFVHCIACYSSATEALINYNNNNNSDKQKEQIEKHLNNDMAIVKTWLNDNKLTSNVKKTKSMLIGNKKQLNEADYVDVRLDMDSMEQVG